jgi:hypothetical protein
MNYKFKFATDSIVADKAYPALAQWQAQPYTADWRRFRYHWPYTVPCELHEHCVTHGIDFDINTVNACQGLGNYYTIGLGFFDFTIDYFALIPKEVFQRKLRVLFYYHEGDNPERIKQRLDSLCVEHGLDPDCYLFISGNTSADLLKNFVWFPDHELLYWHRNREVPASAIHFAPRPYRFTILNRTHKWWRATVMADLQRAGVLEHSLWSYNTEVDIGDDPADNPIEIDRLGLKTAVRQFMRKGPYVCDTMSSEQHNDHHLHVPEHYTKSYCHVIMETHFDADQSGGAFLTEKTFKSIKHGQPFVIVGAAGSLQALRELGYRTFDHVIDNSYDSEPDNTLRWKKVLSAIQNIQEQDPEIWFSRCLDDIYHNQQHFMQSKKHRLNTLYDKLLYQLATT